MTCLLTSVAIWDTFLERKEGRAGNVRKPHRGGYIGASLAVQALVEDPTHSVQFWNKIFSKLKVSKHHSMILGWGTSW